MPPVDDCPCGCGWTKHVIFNRYSVAEMDALRGFEEMKRRAGRAVSRAVKRGTLRKPDACERCNRITGVQAHHEDYTRPLDVIWLCGRCHFTADQERRRREASTMFGTSLRKATSEAHRMIARNAA